MIIDIHTHVGVNAQRFFAGSQPFAQSAVDLLEKMDKARISVAAVFPFGGSLYDDPRAYAKRVASGFEPCPYFIENRVLVEQVARYGKGRLLPFVAVDPKRKIQGQMRLLKRLNSGVALAGLKLHTKFTQSSALDLVGTPFLAFAKKQDIPIIFHSGTGQKCEDPMNVYRLAARFPQMRFIVAHAAQFSREFFRSMKKQPLDNLFVDISPFRVACQAALTRKSDSQMRLPYALPKRVLGKLACDFARQMVFGSDEPFTTYGKRGQEGVEGSLSQEVALLASLSGRERELVSYKNALRVLRRSDVFQKDRRSVGREN